MTQRRIRKSKTFDANTSIRPSVTAELIDRVNNLTSTPKVEYLKSEFTSKFVGPDTAPPSLRRERAIEKWLATELRNEATNERLLNTDPGYRILPDQKFSKFVGWTQAFIESIIGHCPELSFIGEFSGGATTSRKRTESHPAGKYLGKAHVTSEAKDLALAVIDGIESWSQFLDDLCVEEVRGNVLFTVPKNAEIDRVCCKEPDLNMFLQKAMGDQIRKGLRAVGINLNDQSRNQNLARRGSIDGSLATLDLSSASDSMAFELVELLLPPMWSHYLGLVRSPITYVDGIEHRNEMFSSMGNGFTFELESLLFYALAKATAYFEGISGVISVYGDDIICPTPLARELSWVLKYFGFLVNSKKSHTEGSFRESCGGHFISGLDVTPVYLKSPIKSLTDVIRVANRLRKWSHTSININDVEVWTIWSWLRDMVPKSLWGGREYGSITQLVTPDAPRSHLVPQSKIDGQYLEKGKYIHWLNSTWSREAACDGVCTSEIKRMIHMYRSRPYAGMVTKLDDAFLQEVLDDEEQVF